jgi:ribonuclease E
VAFYILNQKRAHVRELETRFGVMLAVMADESLAGTTTFAIDRGEPAVPVERKAPSTGVRIDEIMPMDDEPIELESAVELDRDSGDESDAEIEMEGEREAAPGDAGEDANGKRRRRRRRRGRGRGQEGAAEGALDGSEDRDTMMRSDEVDSDRGESESARADRTAT